MTDTNRHLDDDLRRVPLPEHLRAALTPEALFADAAIDRLLGAVAVPPGLSDRVRAAALAGDAPARNGVVDLTRFAAARGDSAPLAGPAATRLMGRPYAGLRIVREAGRVAAALGLAFLLATAGIGMSRWLEDPRPAPAVAVDRSPAPVTPDAAAAVTEPTGPLRPSGGGVSGGNGPMQPVAASGSEAPASLSAPPPTTALVATAEAASPAAPASLGPESRQVRGATVPFADQATPAAMRVVDLQREARRRVPQSVGFELAFEMTHGESPFVDPAADPTLAVDQPPLSLGTDGFDQLVRGEVERRSSGSATTRLRAEEVLAAMPPAPALAAPGTEPVRLGLAVVRSGLIRNGRPTVFLEATAFAAGHRRDGEAPLRATVILDQGAAGDPKAWTRICRGLGTVAARLEPGDRVSVVLCGPRPRIAIRDADPASLAAAALNWEALPAAGSSDLDAAVDAAKEAGLLDGQTVIVAHDATLDRCRGQVRELLSSWHRALAMTGGDPLAGTPTEGTRFVVLDPTTQAPDWDAGPTFGRTSLDAVAIRRELLRQITGEDTLVARQCSLEIRFDPKRVAAYRLIGHRQSVVESLAPSPPPGIDLHAGDAVRAVYEVVPKDVGVAGLVTARLTWRTPDGAAARLDAADRDADDRKATLPSPHGCELVLAAALGDLAGGSAHTAKPRTMHAALAEFAARWQARGDVTPFGATLIQALDRQAGSLRVGR